MTSEWEDWLAEEKAAKAARRKWLKETKPERDAENARLKQLGAAEWRLEEMIEYVRWAITGHEESCVEDLQVIANVLLAASGYETLDALVAAYEAFYVDEAA